MENAITFLTVIAGMFFSLATAILAEELIFGRVLALVARQTIRIKPGQRH